MSSELEGRIAALPPAQRRLLAARLDLETTHALERLVAFVAAADEDVDLTEVLREHCRAQLPPYMIPQAVVVMDALPRTPSGKIDRRELAERPLIREPGRVETDDVTHSETELVLIEIWSDVLGIDEIGVNDDFFELGGDSLLSIRILSKATGAGYEINPEDFLEHPTIAAQARLMAESSPPEAQLAPPPMGPLPLTPIQAWFFEHVHTNPEHWNQSLELAVREPLSDEAATALVNDLVARHDALRTSFRPSEGCWLQDVQPSASVSVQHLDLASKTPAERDAAIEATAKALHESITLETVPLMRAAYFRLAPETDRLLLVFHHLIIDAFSLGLITEELNRTPGVQRAQPQSMARWSTLLTSSDSAAAVADAAAYWLDRANEQPVLLPATPAAPGSNVEGNLAVVRVELDADTAVALTGSLSRLRQTQLVEALLAGLLRALSGWCGSDEFPVFLESHGREPQFGADLTATVGWMTQAFPAWLSAGSREDRIDVQLSRLRETYRAVPGSGVAYGLLREYGSAAIRDALRRITHPQVCFNFLSRQQAGDSRAFSPLPPRDRHLHRGGRCERAHLLDVNAHVTPSGEIVTEWSYCSHYHDVETINKLADAYLQTLREIAAFSGEVAGTAATPADFPLAGLDGGQLDDVVRLLKNADDRSGSG